MSSTRPSPLGIVAASAVAVAAYVFAQNVILGVVVGATALAVAESWAGGHRRFAGALSLAGLVVAVGVLEPGIDFYGAVVVGTTILAAAGAAIERGVRAGGPVAFAGGVVALAVAGRDAETILAAVVVAAAVLYVSERYGGSFESPP